MDVSFNDYLDGLEFIEEMARTATTFQGYGNLNDVYAKILKLLSKEFKGLTPAKRQQFAVNYLLDNFYSKLVGDDETEIDAGAISDEEADERLDEILDKWYGGDDDAVPQGSDKLREQLKNRKVYMLYKFAGPKQPVVVGPDGKPKKDTKIFSGPVKYPKTALLNMLSQNSDLYQDEGFVNSLYDEDDILNFARGSESYGGNRSMGAQQEAIRSFGKTRMEASDERTKLEPLLRKYNVAHMNKLRKGLQNADTPIASSPESVEGFIDIVINALQGLKIERDEALQMSNVEEGSEEDILRSIPDNMIDSTLAAYESIKADGGLDKAQFDKQFDKIISNPNLPEIQSEFMRILKDTVDIMSDTDIVDSLTSQGYPYEGFDKDILLPLLQQFPELKEDFHEHYVNVIAPTRKRQEERAEKKIVDTMSKDITGIDDENSLDGKQKVYDQLTNVIRDLNDDIANTEEGSHERIELEDKIQSVMQQMEKIARQLEISGKFNKNTLKVPKHFQQAQGNMNLNESNDPINYFTEQIAHDQKFGKKQQTHDRGYRRFDNYWQYLEHNK